MQMDGQGIHKKETSLPGSVVCPVSCLNSFLAPKAECSQLFLWGAHSHVNEQLLQIRAFSVFCFLTSTPPLPGENSKREAVQSQGYVG